MNEDRYLGDSAQLPEGRETSFQDLFIPVLKHRWEVLLVVVLSLLIAFLYNHLVTPVYQAKSTVVLQRYGYTNIIREQETEGYNRIFKEDFNTKMNMIESMPVLKELVENLIESGYYQKELENKNYYQSDKSFKDRILTEKAKQIKGGLSVNNLEETNLIYIKYNHTDPVFAKDVVNTLADLAVKYSGKEQMLSMKNSLSYLNSQLEKSRQQVREAEAKLYEYRQKHDIFQSEIDKEYLARQRSNISTELTGVKSQIKELESQISQLKDLKNKKDYRKYNPVLGEDTILLQLRRQLVEARIEYKELQDRYLRNHPDMVQLANRIKVLKESFDQELDINLDRLNYKLNVLYSKQKYLKDTLAELEDSAISSTEKDIDYIILERQANSARELYRTLLSAVKEVNVNMNNVTSSIMYVQAKSEVPTAPIKPDKFMNILIGILLGGLAGTVLAFGIEYMDQTVHSPEDVKNMTSLDVLSTVPLLRQDNETPVPIYYYQNKKSLFSEGITSLRSHLKVYLPHENPYVLLFTSSMPREGKTLITSNMAFSLAQDGKKTVVLDADLHHPNIHKNFGMDRDEGIFDLIVHVLSPEWSELDFDELSLGDVMYMVRLKDWSGTMKINWDSLDDPLYISYYEGAATESNINTWKEKYSTGNGFPPPKDLKFEMDSSEVSEINSSDQSGSDALEFLKKYPRLSKSSYFIKKIINHYVKKTDFENLDVITAGSFTENPSFVLGSEQMKILIQILKEHYDMVIIDTPPAWPLSDVSVLASQVNGIIWIARSEQTPLKMLQTSIHHIIKVQPNILGVVMNAVNFQKNRYYYYGYYPYRYYKYGYYKDYFQEKEWKK